MDEEDKRFTAQDYCHSCKKWVAPTWTEMKKTVTPKCPDCKKIMFEPLCRFARKQR